MEPIGLSFLPNKPVLHDSLNGKRIKSKYMSFGIKGFEPLNTRNKNECLTAWLYPKKAIKLFD